MSWIQISHLVPGRTRLRSPVLRRDQTLCTRLADALTEVRGVHEVRVRPYTGSALVLHAHDLVAETIVNEAARVLEIKTLARGDQPPVPEHVPPLSSIARKVAQAIQDIDRDILRTSDGSVNLGTLATLGLFGAGAVKIAGAGYLELPPWHNLAWWAFRTFVTTEQDEIAAELQAAPPPSGEP